MSIIKLRKKTEPNKDIHKYIYHHIPKCGGTSLRRSLRRWFHVKTDYRDEYDAFEDFIKNKIDLYKLRQNSCLCGHFEIEGIYLHQRYPEAIKNNSFRIITFLRDPFYACISLYYYEKKKGGNQNIELEDYILKKHNYLANRFPCNNKDYKKVLDRYFFIGITEKLQESFDKLARIIKKPKIRIAKINVSKKDNQLNKLSKHTILRFKRNNLLDYKIYNYALNKYTRT